MKNLLTKMFQKLIYNKDIRNFKKNFFYYIFFRLIRKSLNSMIEVKIYNFKIWASNKKNKTSHSILRKCDFTDHSELKLIKKISNLKKMFLIDCGSNFGFYSLFCASLSDENKIISLEASPSTYKDQKENITLNNFENIKLKNIAITEKDDQNLKLNESKNDWESSLTHSEFDKICDTEIKSTTIDTLINNKDIKEFNLIIKIDIEGHEMNAIQGAFNVIKAHYPLIIIEFSKFNQKSENYNFEFLKNFLKNFDYVIYDSKYKEISIEEVINRLDKLPLKKYTIGNNFMVRRGSALEKLIIS